MKSLYESRPEEDKVLIRDVCNYILNQPLKQKPPSNDFAAIYVDGRDRDFKTREDYACIYSFKTFSKFDYPVFIFTQFPERWEWQGFTRVFINKTEPINSLEEYSEFCKKLYFLLPSYIENVITIQPDGMLLKHGYEEFIQSQNVDWLSSHWKHFARVEIKLDFDNIALTSPTAVGNGGFSYRKVSKMREISSRFGGLSLKECGRDDNRPPMEDLFYCAFMNSFSQYKMPSLEQCCQFSVDPLDRNIFNLFLSGKRNLFGFHFIKHQSEFPYCHF